MKDGYVVIPKKKTNLSVSHHSALGHMSSSINLRPQRKASWDYGIMGRLSGAKYEYDKIRSSISCEGIRVVIVQSLVLLALTMLGEHLSSRKDSVT
jgi:hypothetical protein